MKGFIVIGLVLLKSLSGYAVEHESFSGAIRFSEGELVGKGKEAIKKHFKDIMQDIEPGMELIIETNFQPGTCAPTTATSTDEASARATTEITTETRTTEPTPSPPPPVTEVETTPTETSTEPITTQPTTTVATTAALSTSEAWTTEIATTAPVHHSGPVYENCTDSRAESYFWISGRRGNTYLSYSNAEQVCENCSSVPAVIPDKNTFDEIVETFRRVFKSITLPGLWLGMTFDPEAKEINPSYAYVPETTTFADGISRTNIGISLSSHGVMFRNLPPSSTTHGVVCWKPKS